MQVRNGETAPATLDVSVKTARNGTVVPALASAIAPLGEGAAAPGGAPYVLRRATLAYPVAASLSTFDVVLGEGAGRVEDGFKSPSLIAGVQCVSGHVRIGGVGLALTRLSWQQSLV